MPVTVSRAAAWADPFSAYSSRMLHRAFLSASTDAFTSTAGSTGLLSTASTFGERFSE